MFPLLSVLAACVTADPPPAVPVLPPPQAEDLAPGRAGKARSKGGGAGKASKGAAGPAVGVAGAGTIEVALQATDTSTTGKMTLTFADGSTHAVDLRTIPGRCTEQTPVTKEKAGKRLTPLYTHACTTPKGTVAVHLVQVEDQLVTLVELPNPSGGEPRTKPVSQLALAPGVVLSRKTPAPK